MMNGANPINSLFSSGAMNPASSLFGSPVSFGATFDQAMSQARTPADKAKVLFVQAKFAEQNAMANMFSDPQSSILGFGATSLFGVGAPMGLPSWAYDAERLLGKNSDVSKLMDLSQQAAFLAESSFNHNLSSLGMSGNSVNSLF